VREAVYHAIGIAVTRTVAPVEVARLWA